MRKLQFYLDLPSFQIVVYNDRYLVPFSRDVPATLSALGDPDVTEVAGPYTVIASAEGKQYSEQPIGLTWIEYRDKLMLGMLSDDFMALAAALAGDNLGKSVTLEFIPRIPGLAPEDMH